MTNGLGTGELAGARERVLRDLEYAPGGLPPLSLCDTRTGAVAGPDAVTLLADVGQDAPGAPWARYGTHTFRVTADSVEPLVASIAGTVQDDVIDLAGHPWPEVPPDGGFASAVLVVGQSASGQAVWTDDGGRETPIGQLSAFGAQLTG